MRQEYVKATGEGYIPQECCAFGSNETGGMKYENNEWTNHCSSYRDTLDETQRN